MSDVLEQGATRWARPSDYGGGGAPAGGGGVTIYRVEL